jgi:uncharacterized glyoxalase superfamily protein PhnB
MARFDVLGIVVVDMGRALAFYRLLGLDIPAEADLEGHVEVDLAPGFRVMFDTVEVLEKFSTYVPAAGGRQVRFAFRCESPAEVDAHFGTTVDAGYGASVEPFDAFWGQRYATVIDADGNPVDLYADLA